MGTAQQTAPGVAVARTVANTDVPLTIATHEATQRIIAPLLPKGVTFDQVAAQVRLALAKDVRGDLKKCTVGSVILAVAKACGQGLEVGVTAHLVPMGDQCQMWRDYTGDIQLAIESGMVRRVTSFVVYEHEPFRIRRGSVTQIEHDPIQDPKARGPMVGVYATVYLRGGEFEVEYLTTEEVDAIRQAHSKQWKSGAVPRWYMKKTAIRQALKLIPKTPKLRELLAALDETPVVADDLDEQLANEETLQLAPGAPMAPARISGPKALTTSGQAGYGADGATVNNAPVPPAQHADDPAGRDDDDDEDWENAPMLPLGAERTAPTPRRDAMREG